MALPKQTEYLSVQRREDILGIASNDMRLGVILVVDYKEMLKLPI